MAGKGPCHRFARATERYLITKVRAQPADQAGRAASKHKRFRSAAYYAINRRAAAATAIVPAMAANNLPIQALSAGVSAVDATE